MASTVDPHPESQYFERMWKYALVAHGSSSGLADGPLAARMDEAIKSIARACLRYQKLTGIVVCDWNLAELAGDVATGSEVLVRGN